ncbi:hypothetical protein A4A49_34677 [Nicotiana attenuata]|uniref:Uncharacterized protein n=1 Tax=Nicotiana attenuata TaxID=49451 RepID=A0A1J6KCA5_NICAT|nr:hypothetical protein A4A49_34677 [Nicotiana attenuata]
MYKKNFEEQQKMDLSRCFTRQKLNGNLDQNQRTEHELNLDDSTLKLLFCVQKGTVCATNFNGVYGWILLEFRGDSWLNLGLVLRHFGVGFGGGTWRKRAEVRC